LRTKRFRRLDEEARPAHPAEEILQPLPGKESGTPLTQCVITVGGGTWSRSSADDGKANHGLNHGKTLGSSGTNVLTLQPVDLSENLSGS
jgi:hypothetical protein